MTIEKKILSPRLFDASGDLKKRWFIYWSEDGKRIKKYGGINSFHTLQERREAAQKLIDKYTRVRGCKKTEKLKNKLFRQIENRKAGWRPKTVCKMKSKTKNFFSWLGGRSLDKHLVQSFFQNLLENGKADTTYNDYLRILKQVFGFMNKEHLFDGIQKRKENPIPAQYFTQHQVRYISKYMSEEKPELWFFVQFVYYCFLRPRSELRFLKVGDVILEERKILVRAEISKNKKQQYIAIPDAFYNTLYENLIDRNPNEYIFYTDDPYKPMAFNKMGRHHRDWLKSKGFDTKKYKVYSWKHTGAVAIVRANVHIKQLQIQLRHHSLDQVNEYLRQLGVEDLTDLSKNFPKI